MKRTRLTLATTIVGVLAGAPGALAAASSPSAGASFRPAVSGSGRFVAFVSTASNLVSADTNRAPDVFVRDRGTGRTERVSVNSAQQQARHSLLGSGEPAISADGRFVAFVSAASNLVDGDTNGALDVFVRDRMTARTTRASVGPNGAQATRGSALPAISADGRYVAFVSAARGLVAHDSNHAVDVFVRDLSEHRTERVSVSSSGAQAHADAPSLLRAGMRPAISADGRVVAFASSARDLVAGDANGAEDVFVRDRDAARTTLASVDSAGAQRRRADSAAPSLSGDGARVAFVTDAAFDAADANQARDVYVRDRSGATTRWTAPGSDRAGSAEAALSGDGRYVLFETHSRLLPVDVDSFADVYRYELATATTTLASIDTWYGRQGDGPALQPSTSTNGYVVAFTSAGGLIPDDTNPAPDVLEQVLDATRPSISFLGLVSLVPHDVGAPQPPISDVPAAGQVVYRVWGGGTRQFGASWTPVPPSGLGPDRYRYETGLPDRLNAGINVSVGKLDAPASVVLIRPALPLNPNDDFSIPAFASSGVTYRSYTGGVIEYIIPGADAHVLDVQTQPADPAYGGVPPNCTPAPRGCAGDQQP